MAWVGHSTSAGYRHTAGDEFACPKLSTAWDRVIGVKGGSKVFEEISPASANLLLNHVVIHSTPKLAIDFEVPALVVKSYRWDTLTKAAPGFTISKLRVAELMYKTDWYFTSKLNNILLNDGLGYVNHASDAMTQARNKYTPPPLCAALQHALFQFFQPFVSDKIQSTAAMTQWYTCLDWMKLRNAVGHPLGPDINKIDGVTLADFKADIENNSDYEQVRDAALVLVKLAETMLKDGFAT